VHFGHENWGGGKMHSFILNGTNGIKMLAAFFGANLDPVFFLRGVTEKFRPFFFSQRRQKKLFSKFSGDKSWFPGTLSKVVNGQQGDQIGRIFY
jgi:hypothetical protein